MKLWDVLLGGGGIILGLAAFAQAQTFPKMPDGTPGPSLFPQILGVMLAITGAIIVFQSMRPHGEGETYARGAVIRAALVLVAIAFYIAVVKELGFLITAVLVTGSLMFILGVKWKIALPTTVLLVFASMMLFEKILRVPLPIGIWGA